MQSVFRLPSTKSMLSLNLFRPAYI